MLDDYLFDPSCTDSWGGCFVGGTPLCMPVDDCVQVTMTGDYYNENSWGMVLAADAAEAESKGLTISTGDASR